MCADPRFHPWEEISSFDAWMDWMKRNEPQLHAEIDGRREDVLDFLRVQDYSYGSTRFFSPERWTLVGEAGGFLDALYSPGSDFIAFSNTFSCELIERELDGEDVTELVEFYNDFYLALFNTTAHLYRDNFQLFGNPQVMVAKFVYDSSTYFSGIGNAWCHERMRKPEDIERLGEVLRPAIEMLPRMQELFRDWNALENTPFEGVSVLPKAARSVHPGPGRHGPSGRGRRGVRELGQERRVSEGARGLDLPPGRPEPPRAARREPGRSTRWRSASIPSAGRPTACTPTTGSPSRRRSRCCRGSRRWTSRRAERWWRLSGTATCKTSQQGEQRGH